MNFSSIRFRLISAFSVIGLGLFLFMIVVVPRRSRETAESVLRENVAFIVDLLADNLAIGMQMRELDEGAALQQTLDLLKSDQITSVAVLDMNREFVAGLNARGATLSSDTVVNSKTTLTVYKSMKDSDGKQMGYVEIGFSKQAFLKSINNFKLFIWITCLVALGAVFIVGSILSNNIVQPLNRSVQMLRDIASGGGDLTRRLNIRSQDEMGTQASWFNMLLEKLQGMVREIKEHADELTDVSRRISLVSTNTASLAGGMKQTAQNSTQFIQKVSSSLHSAMASSEETSEAVRNIAAALEEMSVAINEVAKNCQHESEIAMRANEKTRKAAADISALEEMTKEIGTITGLIQDIADKTNLLALNAAIQAASAGEAGRGFSVVANEVKELARQTSSATKEIDSQIQKIRETVRTSADEVGGIASIINEVDTISQAIVVSIQQQSATTNSIAQNISATNRNTEQTRSMCQTNVEVVSGIASNLNDVNESAQRTEEGVKENQDNIVSLTGIVGRMRTLVDRFTI
jgi:methyl-accepting chemotaxis protein